MPRGRFISFEGIDGSGKSTQAKLLAVYLSDMDRPTLFTREPGGSQGAEEIRKLLIEGDTGRWSAETELLLFTAARRDHVEKTILPNLEEGINVICDRFVDSTRIYQGVVRADLVDKVNILHDHMIGVSPDITFIIDIPAKLALSRRMKRNENEDRFEKMGLEFQNNLREGFKALPTQYPKRCIIIDGTKSEAHILQEIITSLETHS